MKIELQRHCEALCEYLGQVACLHPHLSSAVVQKPRHVVKHPTCHQGCWAEHRRAEGVSAQGRPYNLSFSKYEWPSDLAIYLLWL
jgi:hypothetical protein